MLYSEEEGSLLGVWEEHGKKSAQELEAMGIMRANIRFWHAADMAAQCSVLGHGCAGDKYCAHCSAVKEKGTSRTS